MERIRIPAEIESKMKGWRIGYNALPPEYIQWHKERAEDSLKTEFSGYTVHRVYMANDGWGDGMKFLHVIVEKNEKLMKLKWSDSQRWYERCPSGGWGLFNVAKAA